MNTSERRTIAIVFAIIVGSLAFIGWVIRQHYAEIAECNDEGGRWGETACHEVENETCTTFDYGNGNEITTCSGDGTYHQSCDYGCLDLPAEHP